MKNLSRGVAFVAIFCSFTANFVFATEKIDINTAPLEDLMKIVHIGEVRAQELISLRPFSSLDDLARIKGIGEKRAEDIKKQGLAWINPLNIKGDAGGGASNMLEAKPRIFEVPQSEPQVNIELVASGEQIPQIKGVAIMILLVVLVLAVFSGATILILKKSLK